MQERESGRLRRNDPRTAQGPGGDEYEQYTEGSSMTARSANSPERQEDDRSGRESGGGWSGYVVPYRYYGPGYRGVGYYSVMYQGAGEGEQSDAQSEYDRRGARDAQGSGWNARAEAFSGGRPSRGFAGRGPKGYQRSDERIREEVSDRLMADDRIDASDIEVEVRNGEVALRGTVGDRWAKRHAEDCAEEVMGVRDVMNQIRVQGDEERGSADAGMSGTTSHSGSPSDSPSSQRTEAGSRSAQKEATAANGRRRATSTR